MTEELIFRSRAPLRLGLAGGGTDVSPFSDLHGGAVLNATIDLYAHAILKPLNSGFIEINAEDVGEKVIFNSEDMLSDTVPLRLHKAIYRKITSLYCNGRSLSFKLTTFADAPPGSGLGTSSTMVVCILQVFSDWLNLGMGEYDIAHLAYQIEREDLAMAGGKQDQYAAAFGGFNFIEFGPGSRVLVNPLRMKNSVLNDLECSTVLYFTGKSRSSSIIIQQQIDNAQANVPKSIDAMNALRNDAFQMKESLLRGDLKSYGEILGRSWESKKQTASNVTNAELDGLYSAALLNGALAGKVSGAGGGGFMMFFVPPEKRVRLIKFLAAASGMVSNFHFTKIGVQGWTSRSIGDI